MGKREETSFGNDFRKKKSDKRKVHNSVRKTDDRSRLITGPDRSQVQTDDRSKKKKRPFSAPELGVFSLCFGGSAPSPRTEKTVTL